MEKFEFLQNIKYVEKKLGKDDVTSSCLCHAVRLSFGIKGEKLLAKYFKPRNVSRYDTWFNDVNAENIPLRVTALGMLRDILLETKEYKEL